MTEELRESLVRRNKLTRSVNASDIDPAIKQVLLALIKAVFK